MTKREQAVDVYNWVKENIEYWWAPWHDPQYTVAIRKGHCGAKSELLAAMLRARGIPARYVEGRGMPGEPQPIPGLTTLVPALDIHFWVEAKVNGKWLELDSAYDSGITHFFGDSEPGMHVGQCKQEVRWEELPTRYKRLYNNPFFTPGRWAINVGLAYHRMRR